MTAPSPPNPGFALAYVGKAQVLMRQGDLAAARAELAAAQQAAIGLSEREANHIGFFDLVFASRTEAAIAALHAHLAAWPCDSLVVSVAANPNGLIGGSGRIGQKRRIAQLMDSLARHYDHSLAPRLVMRCSARSTDRLVLRAAAAKSA